MLLTFVDFLYAVVFGLILIQLYDQVIATSLALQIKGGKILLVIGVFYFIAWDWIHGRLLTIRNPYNGYRRFFIEILIAASGYGAALSAIKGEVTTLPYLAIVLLLGAWWAHVALREVPNSPDEDELLYLRVYQLGVAVVIFGLYYTWKAIYGNDVHWLTSITLVINGYFLVLVYELRFERPPGLSGGPGVPFFGREQMARVRKLASKIQTRMNRIGRKTRRKP